jgi:glucose/arabinose dehydrogenase
MTARPSVPRRLRLPRRLALLWLVLGCLVMPGAAGAVVSLAPVVSGLSMPVAITHAGDSRLFITLQDGRIVIFDGTQLLPTPFLDIRSLVACCGEEGLLSVAFHPDYANNGFFYVYYVNNASNLVIARYQRASQNLANPASEQILLTIPHPGQGNHNGGQLQFSLDGFLYAGIGDGGGGGDQPNNAQNLGTFLGKMLRFDVVVAGGPPFYTNVGSEIWARGLRNPFRFSFDRDTGDLFIGDVGQGLWEEVSFQAAGSPAGANFGWRLMEGLHCFNPSTNCNNGTLTLPIIEYSSADGTGNCSVTGGYRYRGTQFPAIAGVYFYADFCSGRLFGATHQGGPNWTSTELLDTSLLISTFGEDHDGTLYLADYGGGTVYLVADTLFADVPFNHFARAFAEGLFQAGVTSGCGTAPLRYCPNVALTRGEMAVLVLRAAEGPAFAPPPCTTAPFGDVPCSHPFATWIQELAARGITSGCGAGNFCPASPITREQMAVFILRALGEFAPPQPATQRFSDVPPTSPFYPFIDRLAELGITAGCGGGNYCPGSPVTRGEMAVFLVIAFNIPH